MATHGWVSLSSITANEVLVTQATAGEWQSMSHSVAGYLRTEMQINLRLGRTDLRIPWIVRVEDRGPSAKGMSFQKFGSAYLPSKILYRDIYDAHSEAEEVAIVGREAFESGGGRLRVMS